MAITANDRFILQNGHSIPNIGLGTAGLKGDEAERIFYSAIKKGYRLIDSAASYGNEEQVGSAVQRAVRDGIVDREDLFIVTKVWRTEMGYDKARDSIKNSLDKMGLEYIDLVLIHWPGETDDINLDTWKALEKEYDEDGKVRAIGVSNFEQSQLRHLLEHAEVAPMVNQYQSYPGDNRDDLLLFCQQQGIVSMAYSPINRGQLDSIVLLDDLAEKHHKTPAQVALRWALQRGIIPIPKTSRITRLDENMNIFDFELTEEEMDQLKALG